MRTIYKIAIMGTAALAAGVISLGSAPAEPPSSPALTDIVGAGGGITAQLFSGSPAENSPGSLSYDYNHKSPAPANRLWSWDSVNPVTGQAGDTIITKAASTADTTCRLARPDNSEAGIAVLDFGRMDGPGPCTDFARADFFPGLDAGFGNTYVWLAHDATDWSYPTVTGQPRPQPASLTLSQLQGIYQCRFTNWDQVGGRNAPIVPVLPVSYSDTRLQFLESLFGKSSVTPGACVVNGTTANGAPIQENTGLSVGNATQFTAPRAQDDIFPYSIGDWIAQTSPAVKGTGAAGTPGGATVGGHASPAWGHGNLQLGKTAGTAPVISNSFGQPVINYTKWAPEFTTTLSDVVINGCPGPSTACFPATPAWEGAALKGIFSSETGWICNSLTARSDIVSYGFGLLGTLCGHLGA